MPSARLRAITFDVYSALFDTVAGLGTAVAALFRARTYDADAGAIAQEWRRRHMEYLLVANSLDREPSSNRAALAASARQTLRTLQPPLTSDELSRLVQAWETLPPWPDAGEVLVQARRQPWVLGALSNGDADMLAVLLRQLPAPFDHIISTEGGKFKPHPSVYAKALQVLGVRRDELLHVAGSATDAAGATAFGVQTIWVNRTQDAVADPRFTPTYVVSGLTGVLDILNRT